MRRAFHSALVLMVAVLLLLMLTSPVLAATQKYEEYTTGDDEAVELYGNIWGAQTFTTDGAHTVSSVRLKLYREGTPSTITVSIRETADSDPSGTDLTSGTLDGDTFTTSTSGVWYSFELTPYSLEASTMYAIIVRAVAGDATNSVWWRSDATAGAEPDGQEETSDNAGATWTGDSDDDFMFEVWGEPVIDVIGAQAFRGYLEDGDLLFVVHYENTYPPYYPTEDSARYFDLQLRNTTGTTVLAQTVCKAWGNKPGSIYLSADSAVPLTPGSAYRIYLYGDFTGTPSTYYTLTSADWRGDDLTYLDKWVILTAHSVEEYYNTILTIPVTNKGEVLNEEGSIIFVTGIPGLSEVRPDLFQLALRTPGYEGREWTDAFQEGAVWTDMVGPQLVEMFDTGGSLINIGGKDFGALLLFVVYMVFAVFLIGKGQFTAGFALAVPFILLGAWLRMIDIIIIGTVSAVIALLLIWSVWWSKT